MKWKHPGIRYSEYMKKYGIPYSGTNEESIKAKKTIKKYKYKLYKIKPG